jgi:hypothetical protein
MRSVYLTVDETGREHAWRSWAFPPAGEVGAGYSYVLRRSYRIAMGPGSTSFGVDDGTWFFGTADRTWWCGPEVVVDETNRASGPMLSAIVACLATVVTRAKVHPKGRLPAMQ